MAYRDWVIQPHFRTRALPDYEYKLLARDQFLKQQVYANLNETAKCHLTQSYDQFGEVFNLRDDI